MKILITGFNALTIGTAKSPLNIATSARILPKVLKELGYDVTQKAIIPGEDVSQYDKVIVYVFGPNSLSARYWYGAAYTIIKRPDAIISIDDHQTKETVSGFGTFSRGHWRIWKKLSQAGNPVGKMYWDEAQPYKKEIEDFVAESLGEGRTLNQTIRDAREAFSKMNNTYLLDADFIEDKYYQFRGQQ